MNLQSLKLKASTLCAGGTLLVFGGFLTVNLAGCGGGGGGGLTTVPTPRPVGATFRILLQDGTASRGGTVTLTKGSKTYNGTADNTGVAVIPNVPVGTYSVTFTATNGSGTTSTTTRTLSITGSGAQNFVLVQGDTGNGTNTITGAILQNPGNAATRACTATSIPYTASVLISVRDLNDTTGSPIIAQIVRPADAQGGRYTISIPNLSGQRTFRVEVTPADNNGVQIAGVSQTTTFTQGTTTLTNVDICANRNGTIPAPVTTPTPTPAPSGTPPFTIATSTPTPAATVNATQAPGATATAQANATAQAGVTATAGPAATATASANATAQATTTSTSPAGGTTTVGSVFPTNTPGGNTFAGNTAGNTTAGSSTVGSNTAGGNTAGSSTVGSSTAGGTSTTGSTTGTFTSGSVPRTRR